MSPTQAGAKAQDAILASEDFFLFDNFVRAAAGICAIVQPGGSRRDGVAINAADGN
ncbi:hypothetical protein [Phormidium sp. FACHB-1136]|uniref:hypothetical protein n=1 Tax=Phormidium sp. FACHB-1136 TaxID=2692848 RepID=UPI001689CB1A|nr:hypothetical protein [Phormidium sp. FACHB-1136]